MSQKSAEKFRHETERRGILERDWVLKEEKWHLVFVKDHVFSSSSTAATMVWWRTVNWNLTRKDINWIAIWNKNK